MRVLVHEIVIPAMSTIGFGAGVDLADGQHVSFCGDQRSLAIIARALRLNAHASVIALVENWQIAGKIVQTPEELP